MGIKEETKLKTIEVVPLEEQQSQVRVQGEFIFAGIR